MLIPNPNLEFLLSDNILSWPLRVIFLCNFTLLDDPLELINQQRADPHCMVGNGKWQVTAWSLRHAIRTLFPNQRVISVIRVVGISQTTYRKDL